MPPTGHSQHPYGGPSGPTQGYAAPTFDASGQVAPPGMKPRVTATLWEDEGSLCFQVEAKGVCVARREGEDPYLHSVHMHTDLASTKMYSASWQRLTAMIR